MADLRPALSVDEMKKLGVAEMRKAYEKLSIDYNKILNNEICYCPKCGTFKAIRAFYNSKEYKSGVFPLCKDCVISMSCDYDKATGTYIDNKEKTIEMLHMMNLPYLSAVYKNELQLLAQNTGERNRMVAFTNYVRTVKSLFQYSSRTWKDSEFDTDDTVVENTNNRVARKEIKKIFGSGYTENDYVFLQDQYDDFRTRTQVDSISQELYVKQICMSLLEIDKDRKNGKDVTNKLKSLDQLMNSANLQPRQNVDNASTDNLSFGQLIEKWENERPIPEPSEEFKDVDGIGKYIRVWFSGWLAKALGLKGGYTTECEEEINKYIAKKPEAVEEGSSDDIYNHMFGKEE